MAKITKYHSLALADKVLTALRKLEWPDTYYEQGKKDTESLILYPYSNGREQGYALVHTLDYMEEMRIKQQVENLDTLNLDRQVTFAENRNSDDVVVCYGYASDFNHFSNTMNTMTEKAWNRGQHIYFRTPEDAARFIHIWLTTGKLALIGDLPYTQAVPTPEYPVKEIKKDK